MSLFNAVGYAFAAMPTGGFGIDPRSLEGYAPASQWVLALFMTIAGANFALLYRAFVRRKPVSLVRDEEFRMYIGLLALASAALAVILWDAGHQRRGGGDPRGRVPDRLDHDHDRVREHRLQHVARGGAGRGHADRRAHVPGRLGGLDRGLDQGRAPPRDRQGAAARARPGHAPRVRRADPRQPRGRGRAHGARRDRVRAPLRRHLRRRRRAAPPRRAPGRPGAIAVRRAGRLGDHARQRRPGLRLRRARWARSSPSATSRSAS